MTDIRLISKRNRQIKPLVEAALVNELRLLETGIRQTEERLQEFEKKYQMLTQDFISRYENDEFEETMDFVEWIGESRLLKCLKEKAICELKTIFFRYKKLLNHVLLSNYQMLRMINAEHMKVLSGVSSNL